MVEGVGLWLHGDGEHRWKWRVRLHGARLPSVEDRGHRVRYEAEHNIVGAISMALVLGTARKGCHGAVGDIAAFVWLGAGKVRMSGWLTIMWPWLFLEMVSLEWQVVGPRQKRS